MNTVTCLKNNTDAKWSILMPIIYKIIHNSLIWRFQYAKNHFIDSYYILIYVFLQS